MASNSLGVNKPNLRRDLVGFYKEAEALLIKVNPSLKNELKFMSTLPLSQLPFKERAELIRKYRDAIGFDEALDTLNFPTRQGADNVSKLPPMSKVTEVRKSEIGNIYSNLKSNVDIDDKSPFGRFPTTRGSLLGNIYSRINVQFRSELQLDRAGLVSEKGSRASHYFTMGLDSIPTRNALRTNIYQPGQLAGKNTLVYDIETAGLTKGQIREVAFSQVRDGKTTSSKTLNFTPKEFNRGIVRNVDGKAGTLTDFLNKKFNIGAPSISSGSDFAKGIVPFLKAVVDSDNIVGHNISGFDNEQMFVGLARTKEYKKDKQFRTLVDDAFKKVRNSTIDTMELVRQMPSLQNIGTAKVLADTGDRSVYSISNLLLETDLSDRIGIDKLAELMGYDEANDTFKYGLHHAGVDTAVTAEILNAAEDGGLQLRPMGTTLTSEKQGLVRKIEKQIVQSAAITPVTNITDVDQITDDVLRRAVDDYDNKGVLRAARGSELDKLLRSDKEVAYKRLRAGEIAPDSIKLTALEQQIIRERDIAGGIDDAAIKRGSLLPRVNQFMSRDKKLGLPLSGLSGDEKRLGHAISSATSSLQGLSTRESKAAGLARDTLVGRFNMFQASNVQYMSRSGRASMPAQVLQSAGLMDGDQMFSLSVFDGTMDTPHPAVNLVRSLNSKDVDTLETFLKSGVMEDDFALAKTLGISLDNPKVIDVAVSEQLSDFRNAILDDDYFNSLRRSGGINVGQVYDGDNPGVVGRIGNALRSHFNIEGQIKDDMIRGIGLPGMDLDYDRGIIRTAGAVQTTGLTGSLREDLGRAVEGTREVYNQFVDAPHSSLEFRMAQAAEASGAGAEKVQRAYRAATEVILPNAKKGLLGIGIAGAGALLFKRYKEEQVLDETIDFQGYETSVPGGYAITQQVQERIDTGYNGYSQQMDPLATASLTSILNDSRTGHMTSSLMNNNAIYGGIL